MTVSIWQNVSMKKKILYALMFIVLVIGGALGWRYAPAQDILSVPAQKQEAQAVVDELEKILNNPQDILNGAIAAEQLPKVTSIKVYKGKRYMDVFAGDTIIRRYAIRLGFEPVGHKTEEGDGKTPEGKYLLDWRNPKSQFYKSFHVSYPNKMDKKQAKERAVSPGGDIMIHGSSNKLEQVGDSLYHYIPNSDWTFGCIAISNAAIDELWVLMADNTPIEILP